MRYIVCTLYGVHCIEIQITCVFQMRALPPPHSDVNYLEDNFSENVDVSKSKFKEYVAFVIFKFVF